MRAVLFHEYFPHGSKPRFLIKSGSLYLCRQTEFQGAFKSGLTLRFAEDKLSVMPLAEFL